MPPAAGSRPGFESLALELAGPFVESAAAELGDPLAAETRVGLEARHGLDLSDVRLHRGSGAVLAARLAGARGIAYGDDILLSDSADDVTLEHEVAHVAQARRARHVRDGRTEEGDRTEAHADAAARSDQSDGGSDGSVASAGRQTAGVSAREVEQQKSDAIAQLIVLRTGERTQFLALAQTHEAEMFFLLSAYGYRGCWNDPSKYFDDYDAAVSKWMAKSRFNLPRSTEALLAHAHFLEWEQKQNEQILAALPDGSGYIGSRRGFEATARAQRMERALQTLKNIAGGPGGALGYALGGDKGSDMGATAAAVAGGLAGIGQQRNAMRQTTSTPSLRRDNGAEVRSAQPRNAPTGGGKTPPPGPAKPPAPPSTQAPVTGPPPTTFSEFPPMRVEKPQQIPAPAAPSTKGPSAPAATAPPAPAAKSTPPATSATTTTPVNATPKSAPPEKTPAAAATTAPPSSTQGQAGGPAAASGAKSPASAGPNAGITLKPAEWRQEWTDLAEQASQPVGRVPANGYAFGEARSKDGRLHVSVTEGVVTTPIKNPVQRGAALKGEQSAHPIGANLGEDLGPSNQASAPLTANLSQDKTVENFLRQAADKIAFTDSRIEVRSTVVSELRVVNGETRQVQIAKHREAWLRKAGSDTPIKILDYKTWVDPVTRAVRENGPPPRFNEGKPDKTQWEKKKK